MNGAALSASQPRPADAEVSELRTRWRTLVGETLPATARGQPGWPIRRDHCFARVILDAVCGRPWREALPAPAWRHLSADQLRQAIALAQAIVAGAGDLGGLNRRSLQMRGKLRG